MWNRFWFSTSAVLYVGNFLNLKWKKNKFGTPWTFLLKHLIYELRHMSSLKLVRQISANSPVFNHTLPPTLPSLPHVKNVYSTIQLAYYGVIYFNYIIFSIVNCTVQYVQDIVSRMAHYAKRLYSTAIVLKGRLARDFQASVSPDFWRKLAEIFESESWSSVSTTLAINGKNLETGSFFRYQAVRAVCCRRLQCAQRFQYHFQNVFILFYYTLEGLTRVYSTFS